MKYIYLIFVSFLQTHSLNSFMWIYLFLEFIHPLNSLIEFLCQLVKCVIQWLSVSDLGVPIEQFWKRMKELHSWRLSIVKKEWSYWHSLLSHVSSERNQSSCSKYSNIIIQIHKRTKRDKYTNLSPKKPSNHDIYSK